MDLSLPLPSSVSPSAAASPAKALLQPRVAAPPPAPTSVLSLQRAVSEETAPGTPRSDWERVAYEEAAALLLDPDLDYMLDLFAGPVPYLPAH